MQYCCVECFNSPTLKQYIEDYGETGNCDFCGAQNVYCIQPTELEEKFIPIVGLYGIIENFMPLEDLKTWDGDFIWDKLNEDWDIFTFYEYGKQKELVEAIFAWRNPKDGDDQFLHSYVEMEDEYWGDEDEVSEKLGHEWDEFCEEIKYQNRYFPTRVIKLELLSELLIFQEEIIEADSHFYRARICHNSTKWQCSQMGKPSIEKSIQGRANPVGIPYLYISSDDKTAISEKRPAPQDKVTVGDFVVRTPLKVVNLRNPIIEDPFQYGDNLEFVMTHLGFLRKLGFELSKTISPTKADIEYIPLQYLCEFIKNMGFDGVVYKSSVSDGYNLAIFYDNKLECVSTELYEIDSIEYIPKKIP